MWRTMPLTDDWVAFWLKREGEVKTLLEQVYPERFAKRYGFWRPYLKQIMVHYLACTDGCFYREGLFRVAPKLNEKALEKLFRVKVLAMLLRKKKISPELIRMLDGWRHSGFNVFAGERIQTIRYYGAYANSVRGKLRKRQEGEPIPTGA